MLRSGGGKGLPRARRKRRVGERLVSLRRIWPPAGFTGMKARSQPFEITLVTVVSQGPLTSREAQVETLATRSRWPIARAYGAAVPTSGVLPTNRLFSRIRQFFLIPTLELTVLRLPGITIRGRILLLPALDLSDRMAARRGLPPPLGPSGTTRPSVSTWDSAESCRTVARRNGFRKQQIARLRMRCLSQEGKTPRNVFGLVIRTTEGDTEVADEAHFSRRTRYPSVSVGPCSGPL